MKERNASTPTSSFQRPLFATPIGYFSKLVTVLVMEWFKNMYRQKGMC